MNQADPSSTEATTQANNPAPVEKPGPAPIGLLPTHRPLLMAQIRAVARHQELHNHVEEAEAHLAIRRRHLEARLAIFRHSDECQELIDCGFDLPLSRSISILLQRFAVKQEELTALRLLE